MRSLFTVGLPDLPAAQRAMVDAFRAQHDPRNGTRIAPHVTLVFGVSGVADDHCVRHVAAIAAASAPIDFVCRHAALGTDHADGSACVFLVPDEGHASLALLHDRLYTGLLEPFHRLDIPFTPHITIGSSLSHLAARDLCRRLNANGVRVAGRIGSLTVGALDAAGFTALHQAALGAGAQGARPPG